MNNFTFSKRLYSVQAQILFLLFVMAAVIYTLMRPITWLPGGLPLIALLICLFTLNVTISWRQALKRGSMRWMQVYFAVQLALFGLVFTLENWASGGGSATGSLIILLLIQSCVLAWRIRLMLLMTGIFGMFTISLLFLPALPVILTTLALLVQFSGVLLIGNLIVSEERAHHDLAEAHRKLTDYAAHIEELAVMRERNHLAREIHDSLGHYLTIVNVQIEVAKTFVRQNPDQALTALSHAQQSTQEGLKAVRQSVAALRGGSAERNSLHQAIEQLVEEHRAAGLEVDFRVEGQVRPVPDEISLTLYRAAQEGLTNVRRHAQAKHTAVALGYQPDRHISLSIQDDGIGRDDTKDGFGLAGIQERVTLVKGIMNIETAAGQGFRLRVEVEA